MTSIREQIINSMARTIFLCAWADNEGNEGRSYPGQELDDIAPETPPEAFDLATAWAKEVEDLNGDRRLSDLYEQAKIRAYAPGAKWYTDRPPSAGEFGHCLAFEIMGAGVSWADDYPDHGLKLPYHEGLYL